MFPSLLVLGLALSLVPGCTGAVPADDTGAGDTAAPDTDTDPGTDTDTAELPRDRDGDGVFDGEDCNDRDRHVYPGAPDGWDDVDNDCDGVVDADGDWSGSITLHASAVYEGRPYYFTLDCPFAGTRILGTLAFTITCTPDPSDEDAQRLLGKTLILTPDGGAVWGDTWEDNVEFTSANGWDSTGEGSLVWADYDTAEVRVEMRGVSLVAAGTGGIVRG